MSQLLTTRLQFTINEFVLTAAKSTQLNFVKFDFFMSNLLTKSKMQLIKIALNLKHSPCSQLNKSL